MAMKNKGQAEILDGLLLLLIVAICSITLISIAGNYGTEAIEKYEIIAQQKISQNALLSLYHITENKKSIMAVASLDLSAGYESFPEARLLIEDVLNVYEEKTGWHFGFAIIDEEDDSLITTAYSGISNADDFKNHPKVCATAALTYPMGSEPCPHASASTDMCYRLFQVCTWQI